MKKILILTVCMVALNAHVQSQSRIQNSLSGKIVDAQTNAPLVGATIYFTDLKKGTNTNTEGEYKINHLPKGNFLIEINFLGYTSKVQNVVIVGETKLDFRLSASVTEIREVVVTGVSAATEVKRNPVPTQIVGKEALIQSTSTNVVDAISHQPGVAQVSTGQAISKPVIRGLGYNRIISLYDGIRQEGQQWGDEHGLEIDEYAVSKVEIVKGPGSLMHGSDGIGGVVNFLSENSPPDGKIVGNITTNYQTNNHLIGYSIMNSGNIKGLNWSARLSNKLAGNYSNRYDGKVYNSGFKEFDYNGFIGLNRAWGYSQLHFATFNQRLALPEGDRDSEGHFIKPLSDSTSTAANSEDLKGYSIGIPNQWVRHQRLYFTNNFIIGPSKLMLDLGYQLNRRQEFGFVQQPKAAVLYFHLQTINYSLKYFLPEIKGWKMSAGISGMEQENKNKGVEFLIPDYKLFDFGNYIFIQKKFEKLNLSGGLRYDVRSIHSKALFLNGNEEPVSSDALDASQKFQDFTKNYYNFSGSIGGTYHFSEHFNLKVNLSRGFRAPNIAELSSNGRHEGSFRYELGSPDLKAETSLQSDLGLTFNTQHITASVDLFNNQIQNYIYAIRLRNSQGGDSIADPEHPVPTYQFGHKNAVLTGGEISMDIHPHPLDWLHFENSFSIVRGWVRNLPDSSKYLPFIPAPRFQSELKANLKKYKNFLSNGFARIGVEYYFKQNQYLKENHTETATPAYTLVNAALGTDFLNKQNKTLFTLVCTANNLINIAYQSHLSRLKYSPVNPSTGRMGIFNMGRNISLKLMVPLEFR